MDIKVTPEPAEVAIVVHEPKIAMRKELYILMYQIAQEQRDEAMKADGKNQDEAILSEKIS